MRLRTGRVNRSRVRDSAQSAGKPALSHEKQDYTLFTFPDNHPDHAAQHFQVNIRQLIHVKTSAPVLYFPTCCGAALPCLV
ncbi:hypothetical protein ACFGVS_00745 [Mucilaginibacter sp. AW1-7]|uniref:hypothetical protein n=1 Tax=Mucilaginibacter sp. AW1-7 TaxID=3349874 RepID=UPI003F73524D